MQHLVATCALLVSAAAFNFDVEHADIFTDPSHHPNTGHQPDSYFGYTVNLLKEPGFSGEATLLAGAPRGNSTIPNHQRLIQPGVVYQCVIDERSRPCKLLVLDSSGNELVQSISGLRYMDNKNHAWIGGAMAVQNSGNGRIVVCGPRWKNQVHKDFYLMNGVCYWYINKTYFGTNARKIIPLVKQAKQGYNVVQSYDRSRNITEVFYYAYGGAGISVEFVENSMEMLVGAPGVFDWIGSVIRYQDYTLPSSVNPQAGFFTKVLVPNPYKTPRLSPSSYFGYSVGSGKFFSSHKTLYVGGAPRDGVLKGKVYIFDYPSREEEPLDIKVELMGTQMGEYFGSSICVVDLNSDGLDDLVVGAPLHSLKNFGSLKQTGDEGRIYVFINEDNGIMTEIGDKTKIMGLSQQGARFGTAISKIGDLNHDGYPDIAVGAPYENEGRGAIYIFHGMKSGIKPKFVQRIAALEIAESIRGFGISITKGIDLDSNHYKDIAVGAYLSGHAIILKSHPIITFHPKLETNVTNINFNATGFSTKYCLLYNGNYAPPSVDVTIKLKADVAHGRANFINKMGTNSNIISITRKIKHVVEFCEEFEVEILPLYQDFTQPIDISMEYKLADSESPRVPSNHREKRNVDRQFCKFCPVVDPSHPSQVNRRISYVIGCGEDGKCRTDLKTEISLVDEELPFVIGTAPSIELKVAISNSGDPAFLAKTKIILPAMLSLLRIPSFCQEEQSDLVTDAVLICDIGNPLPKNDSTEFFLELDTKNIPKKEEMFTFIANSSSVGMEISGEDNGHTLEIPLKLVADVSVLGKSSQSQFYLPKQNEIKSHKTFSFSHAFEVRNYGPSPVEQVKLTFKFPTMIENREGHVNFMKVYHPETSLNSQSFPCTATGSEFYVDTAERNMTSLDIESSKSEPQSLQKQEKRRRKRDLSHEIIYTSASLPSNKTFFSNCTLPGEGCMVITCIAGPFTTPRSIASLIFPIKVLPYSFGSISEENDIILVSSIGSVSIIDPPYSIQPDIHRPDLAEAYTLFLGSITEPTVDSWIIALSIAGGILILLLVTLGLVKFGFFKRHKKEELEELKYHAEVEKSFREDFN